MTKNKKIGIAAATIILLIAIASAFIQHSSSKGRSYSGANTATTTQAAKTYTLAQVAMHNNSTSCWTAINGGVYDVTAWISQHPGGQQAILGLCGTDGSAAFNGQHGGQSRPASELAGFKIGALAK